MQHILKYIITRCRIFAVAIGLFALPLYAKEDNSSNFTVTVTGTGSTYEEAKSDAVKNALQYTLKQLVIVDRIVNENEVLRDRVLSTSNGYVEKFLEKHTNETSLGYSVEAEVTISATRIENFLGVVTSGGGEFNGSLLSQEMQKQAAQLKAMNAQGIARGEIFDRLFENYPTDAIELKLLKINISPTNPNILILDIERSYKTSFVRVLEETLSALSLHECEWSYDPRFGFFWYTNKAILCPYNDKLALFSILEEHAPSAYFSPEHISFADDRITYATICIGYGNVKPAHCYLLDHGTYFGKINTTGYQMIGRFVDANGQNVLNKRKCITFGNMSGSGMSVSSMSLEDQLGIKLDTRVVTQLNTRMDMWTGFHLSTEKKIFQVEIDTAEVNLQHAVHLVAIAGFMDDKGEVVGLTQEHSRSVDFCSLLDDAVTRYMSIVASRSN